MTLKSAQKWLGIYFLLVTSVIGSYLLLSSPSMLPIEPPDKTSCFQIIIPVLLGQLVIIFQFISNLNSPIDNNEICAIPSWAIKLPPLLVVGIVILAAISLIMSNDPKSNSKVSPETFKTALTFAIAFLNATTVYLVGKIFPSKTAIQNRTELPKQE